MQILLMVILGKEELRCAEDFGGDGTKASLFELRPKGFFGGDGLGFLLLAGGINPRTVLRAVVIALAHTLGWVVAFPEGLQDGGAARSCLGQRQSRPSHYDPSCRCRPRGRLDSWSRRPGTAVR